MTLVALLCTAVWGVLNVSLNVYNKWLFQIGGFRLPLTLVVVQQACTFALLYGVHVLRERTWRWRADAPTLLRVAVLGALFGINTVTNMQSLVVLSLAVNQSIRAFLPIATMGVASIIEGARYPRKMVANAFVLCTGVVLCVWGNPNASATGVTLCVISVMAAAAQNSLAGRLLSSPTKPTAIELTLYQSGPLCLVVAMLAAVYEADMLSAQEQLGSARMAALLGGSAAFAIAYNIVRFLLVQKTSSVFLAVAGNLKIVLLILIDAVFFHNPLTPWNVVGVLLTCVAFALHTTLSHKKSTHLRLIEDDAEPKRPTTSRGRRLRRRCCCCCLGTSLALLVTLLQVATLGEMRRYLTEDLPEAWHVLSPEAKERLRNIREHCPAPLSELERARFYLGDAWMGCAQTNTCTCGGAVESCPIGDVSPPRCTAFCFGRHHWWPELAAQYERWFGDAGAGAAAVLGTGFAAIDAMHALTPELAERGVPFIEGDCFAPVALRAPVLSKVRRDESSVILRLNARRHWQPLPRSFEIDTTPWRQKRDAAVWRGGMGGTTRRNANGEYVQRAALVRRLDEWARDPHLDVRVVQLGDGSEEAWLSKEQLMGYKMIVSAEGNDVASGLKWNLLSSSTVVMPPPTVASWGLETLLVPWVHYVPLHANMSNLPQMARWCLDHPDECEAIGVRGRCFAAAWLDEERERRIERAVVDGVGAVLSGNGSCARVCSARCA